MKKTFVFTLTGLAIGLLFIVSVKRASRSASLSDALMNREAPSVEAPSEMEPQPEVFGSLSKEEARGVGGLAKKGVARVPAAAPPKSISAEPDTTAAAEDSNSARAWFPETFLFEPLIVTDAQGRANVPVKVPDRLTTWRVLALAHSRQGSQAGSVTRFLGTLPTYVDPVLPPFLFATDSVRLPIQVVNTTDAEVSARLGYEIQGATLSTAGGNVKVPAGANAVQYVTLNSTNPGVAVFKASLGQTDAVQKTIELKPLGRREVVTKGGTLAATRSFTLTGSTNPLPGTEAVRLRVYPGALGLIRSELSAAPGRGGVAEDAYLLQLLGQAAPLLTSLGAKPDEPTIRTLSLLATQRVMQHARTPSLDTATLLTEAALAHRKNPVLERLGERLAAQVAQQQRPDGTCQGANGWTLQRLLVATAECVRAANASTESPIARQRAVAVTLKATGAFQRNLARVSDAYTAAALLASGAVDGDFAETLRKLVLAKIVHSEDGAKYLEVDRGVVRADGASPSKYEATAMAILALSHAPDAPLADLGTFLLSGYTSHAGWGDGRANLVALRAAITLFKEPVPAHVTVTLERDGRQVAAGQFDSSQMQEVLSLDAAALGSDGPHEWTLRSEPAVPGLGFSFQLVAYAPWKSETSGGMDLQTVIPKHMTVGVPAEVSFAAAVPGGKPIKLAFALPAGMQADTTSLSKLVENGAVSRYESEDGLLTLHLPAQGNGVVWSNTIQVVATLGGTLHSGSSSLAIEGSPIAKEFAPLTWRID